MDINLAPLRYRHVHKSHGGPIAEISVRETDLFGAPVYEAYTTLDAARTGLQPRQLEIYGSCHGTGTSKRRSLAVYKAVSEALERWAWENSFENVVLNKALRFDLDPSSTGFAAYPSISPRSARRKAFAEAVERISVAAWWEGKLRHETLVFPEDDVKGIRIESPWKEHAIVALWSRVEEFVTYGFACSSSAGAAITRAKVELCRNVDVLDQYLAQEGAPEPRSLLEKRLLHFAQDEGAKQFRKRLLRQGSGFSAPPLVVDCAVPGPWEKYAHVWRCLFDNSALSRDKEVDYFLF